MIASEPILRTSDPAELTPEEAYRRLRRELDAFFHLNPDLTAVHVDRLRALAERATSAHFADVEALAEQLVERYVRSPHKTIAAETLTEYFGYLQRSARLLAENGVIRPDAGGHTSAEHSVALVPREQYTPLEWCRVVNRTRAPHSLIKAVEAVRRRNELVATVLEQFFIVMQCLDSTKAFRWQQSFLERYEGRLDPDVVRDMINAWLGEQTLPRHLLAWAESWSADENLMQQWPQVVRRADRLLCRHALRAWLNKADITNSALAHLRLLVRRERVDDMALLKWLKATLVDVGQSILRFVSLSKSQQAKDDDEHARRRCSGAIVREIAHLEALFTPVMLVADRILAVPDGANLFAVAFFGLVGPGREQWEKKLTELAENAVRRAFLIGLRDGHSPLSIIKRLTFGDENAYERALSELDAVSMNFDSRKQREKVVRYLAVYYASYHEADLLGAEVLRRYRHLMRLMHEDHLRRVLSPADLEDVLARSILRDLASVAADARRYLSRRRALESGLEELVAAELEFIQSVRQRRLRLIHTLLE